jgi:DNA topoisomerase-3
MRLIIAEKPSLGRSIASALGIQGSGREFIRGKDAIVTWAIGHLGELAMPDAYDPALKRWTWGTIPFIPTSFKIQPAGGDTMKQFRAIKELINSSEVTEIVNGCDAGREGEYIFDLIYRLSGSRKPILRLWPKSLTDDALREAYRGLKPGSHYHGLRDAARCRSEADFLIGLNGTRAQTLFARIRGKRLKGAASIGRVQTPLLQILYLRHREIADFVPQDFWTVHADFHTPLGTYTGKWFRTKDGKEQDRLEQKEHAEQLLALLKDKPAQVVSVEEKNIRKESEQLYDLTTLQREANRRFGYTAEHTLRIAQQLYEDLKVLSYPRTNSRHLCSDDLALLPGILNAVAQQSDYAPFVAEIRAQGWDRKKLSKRYVDDSQVEDHSALTPTEVAPRQPLTPEQKTIYDLVVRRVLAMFYPERIEAKTTIITLIDKQRFKTNGTVCKQEGWSAVDPTRSQAAKGKGRPKKDDPEGEASEDAGPLPNVQQGQSVDVAKLYSKQGKTTPPKHYTEDTLLGAMVGAGKLVEIDDAEAMAIMKDKGLGTPVTRGQFIEKLISNGFVKREKKMLLITPEGIDQIESIEVDEIKSPALTAEWEGKLARMQRDEVARAAFMKEIADFTTYLVDSIKQKAGSPEQLARADQSGGEGKPLDFPCPRDRGKLSLRSAPDGRMYVMCEKWKKDGKGCSVVYTADAEGEPLGGFCKHDDCGGPVQITRGGSRLCTKCERWQDEGQGRAAGTDTGKPCLRCAAQNMVEIKVPSKKVHFWKCEGCGFLCDPKPRVVRAGCKATGCGGDLVQAKGKYGPYRKCVRDGCRYHEPVEPATQGGKRPGKKGDKTPAPRPGGSPWKRTPTEETCPKCKTHRLSLLQHAEDPTRTFHACSDPARACDFKRSVAEFAA